MTSLRRHLTAKKIFKFFSLIALVLCISFVVWLYQLNNEMKERINSGWFKPPVEIYSRGEQIHLRDPRGLEAIRKLLLRLNYRERSAGQLILNGDFSIMENNDCEAQLDNPFSGQIVKCLILKLRNDEPEQNYLIGFNPADQIELIKKISNGQYSDQLHLELEPILFAQFYEGEPVLRKVVQVGDVPFECLQAVTAIEDSQFLEHKGVSMSGLARAILRNLFSGRYSQGGSTITQQLVKNYFLSSEKTLKRKFTEIFMALLLESHTDKDQILSSYLNVVYMGNRGPFQVIGLSSASDYYFDKPIDKLNLAECSLLAAIINSPGRYNPFTHAEAALKRRNIVLDRMVETNMITPTTGNEAKTTALPKAPKLRLFDPAPYYVQALFRELKKLEISPDVGLKIYSSLDIEAQSLAQEKVLQHVNQLELNNKNIKKQKELGKNIEAALVSVDVSTGDVLAIVGGRQYTKTQYNRILDAHRQVGSIMKPFVYLTALESRDAKGEPYAATTLIDDVAFQYAYEGQSWAPKNYDGHYYGSVPLYFALKNSLNVATAKLGLSVGLKNIIEVAERAGMTSEMKPFPALTLGAFEIYPLEVAESYLTLARMGERIPLRMIRKIVDGNGELLYEAEATPEVVFSSENVAVLIGMMKQTFISGTAQAAKFMGFQMPAAGKTGTTSDSKDTWFVGFSPHILTVAWTGYDDNTPTLLTGASGALPLWASFMSKYSTRYPADDFIWPKNVEQFSIDEKQFQIQKLQNKNTVEFDDNSFNPKSVELIRITQ